MPFEAVIDIALKLGVAVELCRTAIDVDFVPLESWHWQKRVEIT
jgi:hypothetical protein